MVIMALIIYNNNSISGVMVIMALIIYNNNSISGVMVIMLALSASDRGF
jgi:hypothetical protein